MAKQMIVMQNQLLNSQLQSNLESQHSVGNRHTNRRLSTQSEQIGGRIAATTPVSKNSKRGIKKKLSQKYKDCEMSVKKIRTKSSLDFGEVHTDIRKYNSMLPK